MSNEAEIFSKQNRNHLICNHCTDCLIAEFCSDQTIWTIFFSFLLNALFPSLRLICNNATIYHTIKIEIIFLNMQFQSSCCASVLHVLTCVRHKMFPKTNKINSIRSQFSIFRLLYSTLLRAHIA
jgi:hypothetical protein